MHGLCTYYFWQCEYSECPWSTLSKSQWRVHFLHRDLSHQQRFIVTLIHLNRWHAVATTFGRYFGQSRTSWSFHFHQPLQAGRQGLLPYIDGRYGGPASYSLSWCPLCCFAAAQCTLDDARRRGYVGILTTFYDIQDRNVQKSVGQVIVL